MSEDRLQQECYTWFHNTYPEYRGLLFHVPNGGNRKGREGAKLKYMGVWAGVADFLFMFGGTVYCIELKTERGSQSPEQKVWEILVRGEGFSYYIIKNLIDFKKIIEYIISLNQNK